MRFSLKEKIDLYTRDRLQTRGYFVARIYNAR